MQGSVISNEKNPVNKSTDHVRRLINSVAAEKFSKIALNNYYNVEPELLKDAIILLTSKGKDFSLFKDINPIYKRSSINLLYSLIGATNIVDTEAAIDEVNNFFKNYQFKEWSIHVVNSRDTKEVSIKRFNSPLSTIYISERPTHFEASVSGNLPKTSKIDSVLNEAIDTILSNFNGKPFIFSDAAESKTFTRLFETVMHRIHVFGSARNPRTGNQIRLGVIVPDNKTDIEVGYTSVSNTPVYLVGFNGLCGGSNIIMSVEDGSSKGVDYEAIVSSIKEKMDLNRKGLSIVSFNTKLDEDKLLKVGVKKVPFTKNLYYYERVK